MLGEVDRWPERQLKEGLVASTSCPFIGVDLGSKTEPLRV